MTTIYRKPQSPFEGFDQFSRAHSKTKCQICGDRLADAHWCCAKSINICYWCAIKTLPALIADAMRARGQIGRSRNVLFETFRAIETNFYRAAAIAYAEDPEAAEISDERDRKELEEFNQAWAELNGDPRQNGTAR